MLPGAFDTMVMKRHDILNVVLISMLFVTTAHAQSEMPGFTDVPLAHPNYTAITTLQEEGIINGYEDNTFRPEQTVTRAEVLKIVLLAMDVKPEAVAQTTFSDVSSDDWFAPYVATATSLGIVGGYADGTFQPNQTVTRVEGLKILLNAKKVELPVVMTSVFTDVPQDAWYAPYVRYVVDHALLEVPGDRFGKDEGLRRKDIAQILYRMREEEHAQKLPVMPLGAGISLLSVWLLSGMWSLSLQYTAQQKGFTRWLSVIGGPFALLLLNLRDVRKAPLTAAQQSSDLLEGISGTTLRFTRQRYTYFRRPRYLLREMTNWTDTNRRPLFGIFSACVILYFVGLIAVTSAATYQYKHSFIPVERTENQP